MRHRREQLVLVATPLGNLGDLSARAIELFRSASVIYCEDTRHSRVLFSANDIPTGGRLESLHEHNEVAQSAKIVERVRDGRARRTHQRRRHPGHLGSRDSDRRSGSGSGTARVDRAWSLGRHRRALDERTADRAIRHGGVRAAKGRRTRAALRRVGPRGAHDRLLRVAPARRARRSASSPIVLPERRVAVVRELTKLHEEVIRGTVDRGGARCLRDRDVLGEIVVVLEGASEARLGERRGDRGGAVRAVGRRRDDARRR